MTYLEQNDAMGRHIFPDLVRAFALFGIVMVNVAFFAWPGPDTYSYGGDYSALDKAAIFTVDSLFLMKSYTLFSAMFGAGLAYQMMSAQRRGVAFAPRYFRRMLGLLLIGIAHVAFAFVGDILIVYAVIGCLLFLFRNLSVKALRRWGYAFLILQAVIIGLMAGAFGAMEAFDPASTEVVMSEMRAEMEASASVYANGSFAEVIAQRLTEYIQYALFIIPLQGVGVIAFFLFGLAGVKSGVLQNPDAPLWSKARRIYFPIGLIISMIGAWLLVTSQGAITGRGLLGTFIIFLGSPFSTLGYLGWIAKWSMGAMTPLKEFMARAGTSTLTAYLMQSLILSVIFSGYGLGLFGTVGAAGCVAIGFATGLVTLSFSSLWRTRFERGPVESLLRSWTYLSAGR
ncbi:DUF418 domain-containing protein [Algimonas porphyrae]|uniref:DUF418 domain-containing protein n=1 Tax=Algimonas porphyrae TaxID=1128113 RepID=A0ABQ5UYZ2_9PROT|nr:DUF418 domain-containing protein [Algimonas porphyrae]GLQ19975.1 hypothetical protein GCM10007854_09300 [Algimonas porphyrae]